MWCSDFSRIIHFAEQAHEKPVIWLIVAASSYAFNLNVLKVKRLRKRTFFMYCICNTFGTVSVQISSAAWVEEICSLIDYTIKSNTPSRRVFFLFLFYLFPIFIALNPIAFCVCVHFLLFYFFFHFSTPLVHTHTHPFLNGKYFHQLVQSFQMNCKMNRGEKPTKKKRNKIK